MPTSFQRYLPNLLTAARLVFAIAFFVILSLYRYPETRPGLLPLALALFVIAAATDWLDGMLARRWGVTSIFGRIMDPVCDKVLVLGAFVFLAGPMFLDIRRIEPGTDVTGHTISGIEPWMVVVILSRELLVTAIRGMMEARGIAFGAAWSGKAKMVSQSIAIPTILFLIAYFDPAEYDWAARLRDVLVWAVLILTILSGWPYVSRAVRDLAGSTESTA